MPFVPILEAAVAGALALAAPAPQPLPGVPVQTVAAETPRLTSAQVLDLSPVRAGAKLYLD